MRRPGEQEKNSRFLWIFPPNLGGIGLLAVILAILPKTAKLPRGERRLDFFEKFSKIFDFEIF